jgi:hypothetical protein
MITGKVIFIPLSISESSNFSVFSSSSSCYYFICFVDEVVQLCCLADANSRLSSANTNDLAYLDNWIAEGKSVLEKSSKKLELLNQRQASLEQLNTRTVSSDRSSSSPSLDLTKTHLLSGSQLTQMVLPSVPNRGTLLPPVPSNIPLLLAPPSNEKSTCLSILQTEFETQSARLKVLIDQEREAKRVRLTQSTSIKCSYLIRLGRKLKLHLHLLLVQSPRSRLLG